MNLTKFSLNSNQAIRRSQSQDKVPIDLETDIYPMFSSVIYMINFVTCFRLNNLRSKVAGLQIRVHAHVYETNYVKFSKKKFSALIIIFVSPVTIFHFHEYYIKLTKIKWSSRNPKLVSPQFEGLPYIPEANERVDLQFLKGVKLIFPEVKRIIREHLNDPSKKKFNEIIFTGHGLGGAYASIAGFQWAIERYVITNGNLWPEINLHGINQNIVTFGAPRIGNNAFSVGLNRVIYHYRITYGNDHVPHFPLAARGWKHFGIEIWIEPLNTCDCPEDQEKYWDCNNSELTRGRARQDWITGKYSNENKECNAGQLIDKVPDQFFHNGPYFKVEMGNCESFKGFKNSEDALRKFNENNQT
ncbi:hypothetical protein G9A89_003423 [Geosiphon pyriformis]|nr:hypothetical protein G9A89_003423 [Geosiphon pyriformis]